VFDLFKYRLYQGNAFIHNMSRDIPNKFCRSVEKCVCTRLVLPSKTCSTNATSMHASVMVGPMSLIVPVNHFLMFVCPSFSQGYVVYSAMGSFFLPMFVMLFFYWRIYRAAVETTRAINQGISKQESTLSVG